VKLPASTVNAVLVRHGLNRLDCLDRPTRAPIRRMEMTRPGELVHVDIKKLGRRIPRGGGWRVHGRAARPHAGARRRANVGYAFIHSAVDAYSRLAYSEVLDDEQGATAAAFWVRAVAFFAAHSIHVERVLTDNGSCYRSRHFAAALLATSCTPEPGRTGPRPTAKSSVSTELCSPIGPTRGPGAQRANAPAR
jgi:hypothetical protein